MTEPNENEEALATEQDDLVEQTDNSVPEEDADLEDADQSETDIAADEEEEVDD